MSEQAKHTPGPWIVEQCRDGFAEITGGGGWAVCDAARNAGGNLKANARLIAAAPDLLAACEAARAFVGKLIGSPDGLMILKALDDAYVKAKGEAK